MLIFDENFKPVVLDDIDSTVTSDYFWVLDLNLMDFTPVPLLIFEEIPAESLELKIGDGNNNIVVPADWHVLIMEEETSILDLAKIGKDIPGMDFSAFTYGMNMKTFEPQKIQVVNYYQNFNNISPALSKHQMLCHPISERAWINITPFDVYSKYFKHLLAGDLI